MLGGSTAATESVQGRQAHAALGAGQLLLLLLRLILMLLLLMMRGAAAVTVAGHVAGAQQGGALASVGASALLTARTRRLGPSRRAAAVGRRLL